MTNQKQFGVWMDLHNAVIVGREETEAGDFAVLGEIKAEEIYPNSNEKAEHNHQKTAEAKFFKEITSHLTNATYIHLTGTGVAQEKFMHYLEETPQFKNTKTEESTANKMSNEKLIEYLVGKFN